MKPKDYLVCYDISSSKQRQKLAEYLETIGFRINKSVFLCKITQEKGYENLLLELQKYNTHKDSTYLFPVCKNCMAGSVYLQYKKETTRKRQTIFVEKKTE